MRFLSLLASALVTASLPALTGCSFFEEEVTPQQQLQQQGDPCASLHAEKAELGRYLQGLTDPKEIQRTRDSLQRVDVEIRNCEERKRNPTM